MSRAPVVLILILMPLIVRGQTASTTADPFQSVAFPIGRWQGTTEGQPGTGTVIREYSRTLNSRFIRVKNQSTYPPQPANAKGEVHEDEGLICLDRSRKKLVLRQFHVEGFVNQFAQESVDEKQRTLVFVSTAIENIPPGWRARETYRFLSNDEFIETFALAAPGKEFATYSETHFRRKASR